jgi:hypothetical protein
VHAVRAVIARNQEHFDGGRAPVVTASLGAEGIVVHDPYAASSEAIYGRPVRR